MGYQSPNKASLPDLGHSMLEYVKWNWILIGCSVVFSFIYTIALLLMMSTMGGLYVGSTLMILGALAIFGIGIYVLVIFYRMMRTLEFTAQNLNDPLLIEAAKELHSYWTLMIWTIILSISMIGLIAVPVTAIISLIKFYKFSDNLKQWSTRHNIKGADLIQLGWILSIFTGTVGTIVMVIGFKQFGDDLISKFSNTEYHPNMYSTAPSYGETQRPAYQNMPAPNYSNSSQSTISPQKSASHYCIVCGSPIEPHVKFCPNCGASVSEQ